MDHTFLIETLFFEGAALAWAGWELWSLRRDEQKSPPKKPHSEDPPGHPEG